MELGHKQTLARLVHRYKPVWEPEKLLTRAQIPIYRDRSRFVTVNAGRRFGKSFVGLVLCLDTATRHAGVNVLYIAATQESVKEMVWFHLLRLNREFKLGGVPNWNNTTMTFANGSRIRLKGVDSIPLADKCRGIPNLMLIIVDECQRYKKEVLQYLLKDVISLGLLDKGVDSTTAVWTMGTPNPRGKEGAFWERWSRVEKNPALMGKGYHYATLYDNETLGTREQQEAVVDELLTEFGETRESAWYQREILARWVVEISERAYKFSDTLNVYEDLPDNLIHFLITADTGVTANDAVAVLGWAEDNPTIYLVAERIAPNQTDNDLGEVLTYLHSQYDAIEIVMDAGGLGKKSLITIKQLFPELPIRAAIKPPINIQVKTLNGRLQRGFRCSPASRFYADIRNFTWVNGIVNGVLDEKSFHSDIVPSVRYGVIAAIPYLPPDPEEVTAATIQAKQMEERRARLRRAERNNKPRDDEDEWSAEEDFSDD